MAVPWRTRQKLIAGDAWDVDTLVAYYCFVNLGWGPGQYDALPRREKALVRVFALRSMEENKQLQDSLKKR